MFSGVREARRQLKLSTANPDAGSAEEDVSLARAEGDPIEIGFSGRYCLDTLDATDAEAVTFELGSAGSPALLRPSGDDPRRPLFVIMPMRV